MDNKQALAIVSTLAAGCDPTTGQPMEDSFLQRGDVIRALHFAVRSLEVTCRSGARKNRLSMPANAGKPWNEQEDRELLEQFDAGQTIAQLAHAHDRTPAGIQARLERHGRVPGQGLKWRGRAAKALAEAAGREGSES